MRSFRSGRIGFEMGSDELEVYKKVYNIVNDNLIKNNMSFGYFESTFEKDAGSNARCINVSDFADLDNEHYFQAVFVRVFKRLPDEKELSAWKVHFEEDKDKFREGVLRSLGGSSVAAINRIEMINNPYFVQKKGLKYKVMGKLYCLTDKSALRVLGKKMPDGVQKIIRKVFL